MLSLRRARQRFAHHWVMMGVLLFASLSWFPSVVHGAPTTSSSALSKELYKKTKALSTNQLKSAEEEEFYQKVKVGPYRKIGTVLGRMALFVEKGKGTEKDLSKTISPWFKISPELGGVKVDVIFQISPARSDGVLMKHAKAMGFKSTACIKNVCSGYIHADQLASVSQDPLIQFIKPYIEPITRSTEAAASPTSEKTTSSSKNRDEGMSSSSRKTGSVTSEGDPAMGSDVARNKYNLDGSGIKVGVLSDSFSCDQDALTDYEKDIATGDLPDNIVVLEDLVNTTRCIDEGRAMLQIIHDVAPGASLAFHTAFTGAIGFALGIASLAEAGANVIVDDVGYADQPFFQDGVIAQAADFVSNQGIPYFSSAGNAARRAWHTGDGFVDSGELFDSYPLHNFGTADEIDIVQGVMLEEGRQYFIVFQWDQPFASVPGSVGSASDMDIAITDPDLNLVALAADANVGADAREWLIYTPPTTGVYGISIILYEGPAPGYMKWQVFRGGEIPMQYEVLSSTSYGHSIAAGGAGIGAAFWLLTPRFGVSPAVQEPFSSAGGTPIIFDTRGTRLDSFEIREQPRVTGPDGGLTTFFIGPETRFFGTSASAPHVAAVAALMLEADPNLSPTEVYNIIQDTAIDMNDTATPDFDVGYDTGTGYGFVNAEAALDVTVTGTVAPTSTPVTDEPTESPERSPTPIPTLAPVRPPTPQRVGVQSLQIPLFGDPFIALEYA